MKLLIKWLLNAIAIIIVAYLLQGIHVANFGTALIIALVLGILNAIVRPVLILLSLPITIITFGLFTFVINALLVLLTSWLVRGFTVDGFGWALLFSIVLSIISSILSRFV